MKKKKIKEHVFGLEEEKELGIFKTIIVTILDFILFLKNGK